MNITAFNGISLTPLFHSEITSSYLLRNILRSGTIAKEFIKHFLNIDAFVLEEDVNREKWYDGSGSIDLFIQFTDEQNHKCVLLIEVKVHDYLSVTKGQLERYHKAVYERENFDKIYIAYLTQFNSNNFILNIDNNITKPPTLTEFEEFIRKYKETDKFFHLNWEEVHDFIQSQVNQLTPELIHMAELQKLWIRAQMDLDLQSNTNKEGTRAFKELFGGLDIDTNKLHGQVVSVESRINVEVNLQNLDEDGLIELYAFVVKSTQASTLLRRQNFKMEAETVKAVCVFLKNLAGDRETFLLLTFYSKLFNYVMRTNHLLLNGTGNRGFSIIANHENIPRLSVCTILKSHKIIFGLVR